MKISMDSLTFSYKKNSKRVIDNLSLEVETGKLYVLTGPNGSGKTTLTKLVCGLLKPTGGDILMDGESVIKKSAGAIASKIGYVFQNPDLQLFAPTVYEELKFPYELLKGFGEREELLIESTLKDFGLWEMKDRLPLLMSGGEKQRLAIATVAVRKTEFLILDEPTASVDMSGRDFISRYIKSFVAGGGGVIVITHDTDFISLLGEHIALRMTDGGISYEA